MGSKAGWFATGMILGTGNTILSKVIFTTYAINLEGESRPFDKPWFNTFTMFLGMMILPAVYVVGLHLYEMATGQLKGSNAERRGLLKDGGKGGGIWEQVSRNMNVKMFLTLMVPAVIDLVATYFNSLSLIYITASLSTILRGVSIVFTALARVAFLKSTLSKTKWVGVGVLTLSMAISGLSGVMPSSGSSTPTSVALPGVDPSHDMALGIFFMLVSAFVQSLGSVLIEFVLADDELGVHPLAVVIVQGFWGAVVMLCVVFPITYYIPGGDVGGRMENFFNSMYMVENSRNLLLITLVRFCCVGVYNVSSVYLTQVLDALWNSIMCNARPATVWITDLVVYYLVSQSIGWAEAWTSPGSWMQLAGLVVMFGGIALYGEFITPACLDEGEGKGIPDPELMCTPNTPTISTFNTPKRNRLSSRDQDAPKWV